MILVKPRRRKKISYDRLFQILDEQSVIVKVEEEVGLVLEPPLKLLDATKLRDELERERDRL